VAEETVAIVHRGYEHVTADLEMPADLFDVDIEVDSRGVGAGNFGVIRGLRPAQAALREYWEMFDHFHVEPEEVIHADEEQVVTAVRDGGRIKGSDAEVWNRFFHVWTLRDRKIVRLSIHTDRDHALRAAGLSE
jgi:ketosteroid isomerase-like protein